MSGNTTAGATDHNPKEKADQKAMQELLDAEDKQEQHAAALQVRGIYLPTSIGLYTFR